LAVKNSEDPENQNKIPKNAGNQATARQDQKGFSQPGKQPERDRDAGLRSEAVKKGSRTDGGDAAIGERRHAREQARRMHLNQSQNADQQTENEPEHAAGEEEQHGGAARVINVV